MRLIAATLAASVLVTGCATNTYKIPGSELQRLAMTQPEIRGERVRVVQELGEADLGAPEPVTAETQIVFFPQINVYGPERRRYYRTGSSWNGNGTGGRVKSGLNFGGGGGGGGGGKGDAGAAIAILVVAAVALVAVAAVEGSRFDGFARLHPMHPVYLVGQDGNRLVLPLSWIDPQTAAWARHGFVRRTEGPWQQLERAPLDREGWNFSMYGGSGIYSGIDGSRGAGVATAIQLGYFPSHQFGIVGNLFMGWRDNEVNTINFHARYQLEGQFYPISAGLLQLGAYAAWGGAYRSDERYLSGYIVDKDTDSSRALSGGLILQLDINTRLALTGRFGYTSSFGEATAETLFGLSVY